MSKWRIVQTAPGWWVIYKPDSIAVIKFHHFPSGAEAIAAFAAGGK